MLIIGLTGSIGMGKSTAAAMFRRFGVPTQDADAVVHGLTGPGGAAVPAVEAAFPGVTREGAVDRRLLGRQVFGDPAALKRLEAILHPLVAAEREAFLRRCARRGAPMAVLDIPLLFENDLDADCDLSVLVTAPPFVQAARVLRRPGMTGEKLAAIRAQQMPIADKRKRADVVIETGLGKRPVLQQVARLVRDVKHTQGRHWPRRGRSRAGNHA